MPDTPGGQQIRRVLSEPLIRFLLIGGWLFHRAGLVSA